jgi:hypothetical protein
MSGEHPTRTIYRSSSAPPATRSRKREGRRASASSAPARPRARRRLRDVWWLAPILALLIVVIAVVALAFVLLGGSGLLQYVGISIGGHAWPGDWGAAGVTLGAPVIHIARAGGDQYTITGLHFPGLTGATPVEARVQDDSLVATGTGTHSWRLSLAFVNRDQLRADLTFGDGRPAREIILTRQ